MMDKSTGKIFNLGGLEVRRLLPRKKFDSIGPFIFFDHMGPGPIEPQTPINIRPHPHIGLATLTYLFDGELTHEDSLKNYITLLPGGTNLMVSGSGIVHSERTKSDTEFTINGLQFWIGQPIELQNEMGRFSHWPEIPRFEMDGVNAELIFGSYKNYHADQFNDAFVLSLHFSNEKNLNLKFDDENEIALYSVSGNFKVNESSIYSNELVQSNSKTIKIVAENNSRLIIFGGKPLGYQPHLKWNFASHDPQKIEEAAEQWRNQQFPKIENDPEYIPLPENFYETEI